MHVSTWFLSFHCARLFKNTVHILHVFWPKFIASSKCSVYQKHCKQHVLCAVKPNNNKAIPEVYVLVGLTQHHCGSGSLCCELPSTRRGAH